jgi:hypothetical protein
MCAVAWWQGGLMWIGMIVFWALFDLGRLRPDRQSSAANPATYLAAHYPAAQQRG